MTTATPFGTVKVHFRTAKQAMAASVDGAAFAGARYTNGRMKTWIGYVAKAHPYETAFDAKERVKKQEK